MSFYIAAIVGTILSFVAGCVWYSVIFGKLWMKLMDFDDGKVKQIFQAKNIIIAFLFEWFATACIVGIIFNSGVKIPVISVMLAVALAATGAKLGVFDGKSYKLILLNQGYTILSVIIISACFLVFL